MKADRLVKSMLVTIVVLLALNCAKDFSRRGNSNNSDGGSKPSILEHTVQASTPPRFLQVGRAYAAVRIGFMGSTKFIVSDIDNTGWVNARLAEGGMVWINPSAFDYIIEE